MKSKRITEDQADRIAKRLPYQGYTSVRIFEDGKWVAPATAAVLDSGLEYWNYSWTVNGYRPDHNEPNL
jgi:hypothetical protein